MINQLIHTLFTTAQHMADDNPWTADEIMDASKALDLANKIICLVDIMLQSDHHIGWTPAETDVIKQIKVDLILWKENYA